MTTVPTLRTPAFSWCDGGHENALCSGDAIPMRRAPAVVRGRGGRVAGGTINSQISSNPYAQKERTARHAVGIEQDSHRRAVCRDRRRRCHGGDEMALAGRGGSTTEAGRRAATLAGHPQLGDRDARGHLAYCDPGCPGGGGPAGFL